MAAPKPWESPVPMSSQIVPSSFNTMNNGLGATIDTVRVQGPAPPPPPRSVQNSMGYFPTTNYLSPYSLGPYQTGGYYNNYRLTPYGMSPNMPVSSFTQLAMDESRAAFSSIESVINTFRSISLMLESTFTSVFSSFRAVTDVIDHFTRIRTEITAIYPLVLLWRFLKYLYHRLLRLLGLRRTVPGVNEETWSTIYHNLQQSATNGIGQASAPTSSSSSGLLVALFFLVSFGTPMLMLKFLSSIIKKRHVSNDWLQQEKNQPRAVALYDYVARNSDELSFTRGTTIYLAPLNMQSTASNWFLGSIDRIHTGLVPANYVQPIRDTAKSPVTLHPQVPVKDKQTMFSDSTAVPDIPQSTVPIEEQRPTLS